MDASHGRGLQGLQIGDHNVQHNVFHHAPVVWPVQVGRPPRRAEAFQPRLDLVDQVAQAFARSGPAVLTQVVAAGDGGVGKTQLAAAVLARAREDRDLVVWVTATSRDAVIATYAEACAVAVDGPPPASPEQAARRFLDWLSATTRSWLVVLDDISDPRELDDLWPDDTVGRVLVTTRRHDLGRGVQVHVGVFTPDESLAYLTAKLPPEALDEATELADDLGHLPVALAQAAAVVANDAITCAWYRRRFADRSTELARLFPPDARADDYRLTVATAWDLAIERADGLPPAGLARPALEIAAVLDPNGAPESVWTHLDPGDDMRKALRNLHRLSLVTHDPAAGPSAVRTHALVQRAVLDTLDPDQLDATVRAAADVLYVAWRFPERDPVLAEVMRSNVDALANRSQALWRPEVHPLLVQAGYSLGESGQVARAIAYHEHVLARTEGAGSDSPATLVVRSALARWTGEAGDLARTATLLEQLFADRVRVLGPDHVDTLLTRNNLADLKGRAGDPAGAAGDLAEVVDDLVRVFGADHLLTQKARHNLAWWRGAAGDEAGAVPVYEQLLDDRTRLLGPDHPDTLLTRNNLVHLRSTTGDPAETAAAYAQLLDDQQRVLGPDHPQTLVTRNNLAHWRGVTGDPAEAAAAYEQLLADRLRVLDDDHPHVVATRDNIAHWRRRAGLDDQPR